MIFFQKFFDVSALNLFEDLLECKAFFKAQLHLGQLLPSRSCTVALSRSRKS